MTLSTAYVRVRVGIEQYALSVEHVEEIVALGEVTTVPGSRHGILGVHVLRGEVIAAADLASVLGIASDATPRWLAVAGARGNRAGLAVDEVLDVGELGKLSHGSDGKYVPATTMIDGALVGILDLEQVFDAIGGEQP